MNEDDMIPHRSTKNRKRWCRGKVGVLHAPELRASRWGCGVIADSWFCMHQYQCTACGKGLGFLATKDCPDRLVIAVREGDE